MKRSSCFVILTFLAACVNAQSPLDWHCVTNRLDSATYELVFSADVAPGSYLFSQHQPGQRTASLYVDIQRQTGIRLIAQPVECGVPALFAAYGMPAAQGYEGNVVVRQYVQLRKGAALGSDSTLLANGELQYLVGSTQGCATYRYGFSLPLGFSHVHSRDSKQLLPGTFMPPPKKKILLAGNR